MSPTGASAADTDKATQELKPPVEGQDVATGATGTGPVEPQGDEGQQPKASRSQTAKTVVTSAAKSIVYMHPVFLMGEVITGRKVGTSLKRSSAELVASAKELAELLSVDAQDVIVVIDAQLKKGGSGADNQRKQTYEVLQREGEKALVVVSSSLDKARSVLEKSAPEIKKSVTKNGRDVLVIVDKGLKNPLVITGVAKLAKSRGIPHAEAVIGLASLGMSKILARFPLDENEAEEAGERIEEIDAEEFARQAPPEAEAEAQRVAEESRRNGNSNSSGSSCTVV